MSYIYYEHLRYLGIIWLASYADGKSKSAEAKDIDKGVLRKYWLNAHVEELLEEKRVGGAFTGVV